MLRFDILTVFPEMFDSPLSSGVVGKALKNKIIDVQCLDLRRFTSDQHKSVDDYPFGGGGGMILKPEPIFGAVDHLTQNSDLKLSGNHEEIKNFRDAESIKRTLERRPDLLQGTDSN